MKNFRKYKMIFATMVLSVAVSSCEYDFPNPNNPTEEAIFSSRGGLFAISIGMTQYYSTSALRQAIEAPGITTREFGVTNTFLNINELARGGGELSNESGGITNPWVTLLRAKGMAESIIANIDNVELSADTRGAVLAWAHFVKAASLGYLINMFEQAPIDNSPTGNAVFNTRQEVLQECIDLLDAALTVLPANFDATEFANTVLEGEVNLKAVLNAYASRFSLMNGDYASAISYATAALQAEGDANAGPAVSYYVYDANNVNPIWNRTVNSADLDPQTNFGLLAPYLPEDGDGRVGFYLGASTGFANLDAGGQPLSAMKGFFETQTSKIPIYLRGELYLNRAEAYARQNQLANAVIEINLVRQKNNDPSGVNANLGIWLGNVASQADILEEIYKNRCIELFMQGLRLEDSRRFHPGFVPPQAENTTNERNRNFYPYPFLERENNPNTPADPAI